MLQEQFNKLLADERKLAAEIETASVPQDQDAMLDFVREHIAWLKSQEARLQKVWQCSEGEEPVRIENVAEKGSTSVSLRSPYIAWEVPTLRQQLTELGTRVDLFWEPRKWGKRTTYPLASDKRCRFRMGNFDGPLPATSLVKQSSAR